MGPTASSISKNKKPTFVVPEGLDYGENKYEFHGGITTNTKINRNNQGNNLSPLNIENQITTIEKTEKRKNDDKLSPPYSIEELLEPAAMTSLKKRSDNEADDNHADGKLDNKGIGASTSSEIEINQNFFLNPLYQFSVIETSSLSITVYQKDNRWSSSRQTNIEETARKEYLRKHQSKMELDVESNSKDYRNVLTNTSSLYRQNILKSCMKYKYGIGFIVIMLTSNLTADGNSNTTHTLSEFKHNNKLNLESIVGRSNYVEFSNVCSGHLLNLKPGKYCVIPYTDIPVDININFVLQVQYTEGNIEFDINQVAYDNGMRKLRKSSASEDGDEDDDIESDDNEEKDNFFVLSSTTSKQVVSTSEYRQKLMTNNIFTPPEQHYVQDWEYDENIEEKGVLSYYDEISCIAKYVINMKKDLDNIKKSIKKV